MIYRFNKAQLGRDLEAKLDKLMQGIQEKHDNEVEVVVADFPNKFSIESGGETIAVVVWNPESDEYEILEPAKPESGTLEVDLPGHPAEIDPVELAQRTYHVIKDNLRMSIGQRSVYHENLCELWLKDS